MMKRLMFVFVVLSLFNISAVYAAEKVKYVDINWPVEWQVFGPFGKNEKLPEAKIITAIPEVMSVGGKAYQPVKAKAENGVIDFAKLFYKGEKKAYDASRAMNAAIIFAEINCPDEGVLLAGAGADWWMDWYVDGKKVLDTLRSGNGMGDYAYTNHPFRVKLSKGKHLVSVVVRSGSKGWKLVSDGGNAAVRSKILPVEKDRRERLARLNETRKKFTERVLKNSRLKVVVYGSSVAFGAGAKNNFGWANRLGKDLEKRNWTYVNKSVGGDTTEKLLARIDMDLLPEKPDVVIIGLSLANEGIRGSLPGVIYWQYRRNLRKIIQVLRKNGIVPVVANCYPHGHYTAEQYGYILKFNEELAGWPVYSFDFLGSAGDGQGQWLKGGENDPGHPNDYGHEEMFRSIPLSCLDFLMDGILEDITPGKKWLSLSNSSDEAILKCKTEQPVHSFTFGFEVNVSALPVNPVPLAGFGEYGIVLTSVGTLSCVRLTDGKIISVLPVKVVPGKSNMLAVAYSFGRKELSLFCNGKNSTASGMDIKTTEEFVLIKTLICEVAYRNCFLYYSALKTGMLNKMCMGGRVPYSSLALYSRFDDAYVFDGLPLVNLAPSALQFYVMKGK